MQIWWRFTQNAPSTSLWRLQNCYNCICLEFCQMKFNICVRCNMAFTERPPISVHENHQTHQTFPMTRPKCLMRDLTNLNRIYKAHQTNVWWLMKVFSGTLSHYLSQCWLIISPVAFISTFAKLYSPTSANNSILVGVQYIFIQKKIGLTSAIKKLTLAKADVPMQFCKHCYLRALSKEDLEKLIRSTGMKIIEFLKSHPYFPGANELINPNITHLIWLCGSSWYINQLICSTCFSKC